MQAQFEDLFGNDFLRFLGLALQILDLAAGGNTGGIVSQPPLAGFQKLPRSSVVEVFGNAFEAAQLSNRVLAAQAIQYDAGLLFRGVALVRHPADVLDALFERLVGGRGISVSSSLLAGYDARKPPSSRQICLTGADVGHGNFAAIGLLISAMLEVVGSDCHPHKPLPVLMINGTDDRVLPFRGERTVRGDILWPTERLVAFFNDLNGCAEPAQLSAQASRQTLNVVIEHSTGLYRPAPGPHRDFPGRVLLLSEDQSITLCNEPIPLPQHAQPGTDQQ